MHYPLPGLPKVHFDSLGTLCYSSTGFEEFMGLQRSETTLKKLTCYSLCSDFQNYLRTQTGSTTTINIIICTVDYLLRLQVSLIY